MTDRQLSLERTSVKIGIERYREKYRHAWNSKDQDLTHFHPEMLLLRNCIPLVASKIEEMLTGNDTEPNEYLKKIEPIELAYLTARSGINSTSKIEPIEISCIKLAEDISKHLDYVRFKNINPKQVEKIIKYNKTNSQYIRRQELKNGWRDAGIIDTDWDDNTKIAVGELLFNLLIKSTKIFEMKDYEGFNVLRPIEPLINWLKDAHIKYETSQYVKLPMVSKPLPWTGNYSGGYHKIRSPIIKSRRKESLTNASRSGGFAKVCKALNALQETPWRINKKVLSVIKACKNKPIKCLPSFNILLPDKPWSDAKDKMRLAKEHPERIKEYNRIVSPRLRKWNNEKSNRDKLLYQLWLAESFQNAPEIYFPWNLDWRGRMYPLFTIPVHPQSDKIGKALIEFSRGKRLGNDGVYWLAVHGANCYGFDKESLDERVAWVHKHEASILNAAKKPLANYKFWTKADEPFQFLAFCFEWLGFREHGEDFVSHIPVAIDMSCNGIQHLAYLAEDMYLSYCVNTLHRISPDEKPQDFYATVADEVSRFVEKDANKGNELAKLWVGKVDRSIVKRNVMTLPYGATAEGFKNQLMEELKKRDAKADGGSYLGVKANWNVCKYLATINRNAIESISKKLVKRMEGMQNFAKVVAQKGGPFGNPYQVLMIPTKTKDKKRKQKGIPFPWETPIGLLVEQNYKRPTKKNRIDTFWGEMDIVSKEFKIDVNASRNSIVPNMIHSRDGGHMMLTILEMQKNDITDFCMIHDSFGCHAADAGKMNDLIWDTFDDMYKDMREKITESNGSIFGNKTLHS